MISISNLEKAYRERVLFREVTFNINSQEKIGLIGRNGTGKSTLIKMLLNQEEPDNGIIDKSENFQIRSLEQNLNFKEKTVLKQVTSSLEADLTGEDWKAKSVLMGLGFGETDFERSPSDFSSGFQVRIRLAEALVGDADLLLLDEPTNYLDILSLRWLEKFLKTWQKSFVLVTHDRLFMEKVVTHVVGIHRERMRKMKGGPLKFLDQIKTEEEVYEKTRQNQEKKQAKTQEFIRHFRAGARSAGLVQSRIKALDKQKINEKLAKIPEIKFKFSFKEFRGNSVLQAKKISFGYEEGQPLIRDFSMTTFPGDKIAIIGRNGQGKSTLSKLLVGSIRPQSGSVVIGTNLRCGYFGADSKANLDPEKSILEEVITTVPDVTEQQVRSVCAALLFTGENVKKKIKTLSGGEQSRVCLAKVILTPVQILVLDEPTNHLDMESCRALSCALKDFKGTVLFVTHDEAILSEVATRLVVFDSGDVSLKEDTYSQFLKTEGWSDELDSSSQKSSGASQNKLEYLERKELQKSFRQNQKQQSKLENKIEQIERKQEENAVLMQEACVTKNHEKIRLHGETSKKMSDQLEEIYQELENLLSEAEEIEAQLQK